MRYALSETTLMSQVDEAVLAEDTFLGHIPVGESTKMIDSFQNFSQFQPLHNSSRLPTPVDTKPFNPADETVYYEAQQYHTQHHYSAPYYSNMPEYNYFNNFDYSTLMIPPSPPRYQAPSHFYHPLQQFQHPVPFPSQMATHAAVAINAAQIKGEIQDDSEKTQQGASEYANPMSGIETKSPGAMQVAASCGGIPMTGFETKSPGAMQVAASCGGIPMTGFETKSPGAMQVAASCGGIPMTGKVEASLGTFLPAEQDKSNIGPADHWADSSTVPHGQHQFPVPHPYLLDTGHFHHSIHNIQRQGQVGFYGTEERCSVYSNESFNTSGYVSDQSSPYTPDYSDQSSHYNPAQVDPPEYIHEESVVCRLNWSSVLEESLTEDEVTNEILRLLRDNPETIEPTEERLSRPKVVLPRRKKRACPSPETGKHAKKVRKVSLEPRRYSTQTVTVLTTWLKSNMRNPYPTDQEKKELMRKTGLGRGQIRQWFINARRRYAREGRRPVKTTR